MEKLVVFPLNNDTEILIKGLKEKNYIRWLRYPAI